MTTVNDKFRRMGVKMGNFGAKCAVTVLLLLVTALLPWPAEAGTAGKVYNLSLDIGTLDNRPLYYITSFPTTFKFKAKVMDQLGSPVTGLTSSQLVVHSAKNVATGAVWTAGTEYAIGTFSELGNGLYEWLATINPGALATNEAGQFEVRVTGTAATDNQWLANTIFVKNGTYSSTDVKYVEVQPSNGSGYGVLKMGSPDFYFQVRFYGSSGPVYLGEIKNASTPSGTLLLSIANWAQSSGSVPAGYTVGGYHDYSGGYTYHFFLNGNASYFYGLQDGGREYITVSVKMGNYDLLIPMGLTAAVATGTGSLSVPTFDPPFLFPLTTVQNYRQGSPDITIPPGAGATQGNMILPSTNTGTDNFQGVTLDLGTGGSAVISRIDITDGTGATIYGSLANPVTDNPVVPFSPAVTVSTTTGFYYVRITPKTHADMPPPPGSSQLVPAGVTAIDHTASNPITITEWGAPDLTIDNLSPANPAWGMITPSNGQASLSWTNPGNADYSQAVVLRSTAPVADTPVEGASYTVGDTLGTSKVVCVVAKPGTSCTDTGLTNGTGYHYRIFARDTNGNYSAGGSGSGPHVLSYQTTPGSCAATCTSPTTIDVTMPYGNDANDSNTYTVDYRLSGATGWSNWVTAAPHAASPFVTSIAGLGQGETYDIRCAFIDADAVEATNPQTVTGIVMLDNRTSPGTATAATIGTTAIAVTMPYTDDYNADNTYTVDYQLSGDSGWTNWVSGAPHAVSPASLSITGLQQGGTYNVRLTYVDSDGIKGVNPQTIGITLPDNRTEAGVASVEAINSANIRVSAPFAKDVNGNGTLTVEYMDVNGSEWLVSASEVPHTVSPQVITVGGLTPLSYYNIRVSYLDPDGVIGTAVQEFYWIATPASKLMHNSLNANKKNYWTQPPYAYGGWGIPGGQYGEFTCMTCHELRTSNAAGVKPAIMLMPLPGSSNFGGPVRFDGNNALGFGMGDDSVARPVEPPINRICEVCHTLTKGGPSQTPEHRKVQDNTAGHGGGNECTFCHRHDKGFASPW